MIAASRIASLWAGFIVRLGFTGATEAGKVLQAITPEWSRGRALAAALACIVLAGTAQAQLVNQVTGLAAVQYDGFAALTWNAVTGATDYQIERTPVNASNVATGTATITGLWRPNRTIFPQTPSFADSGFVPGDRFQWRVRARFGTTAQAYSTPVYASTLPSFGPPEFLTQFETSGAATYTTYENEIEWTRRIDAASERVRVVTIGHTVQGREINLFIIGYPGPLATAKEISDSPSAGTNCNVHGNEPSGREACFMLIRQLAFSNDPWVIDILSHATVLIIPSINGDGRFANIRGNGPNPDINRDYGLLTQPESQAMIKFWRDYTPDTMNDSHEYGNNDTCDLPIKNTSQLMNSEFTYNEGKLGMVEGWMYENSAADGWWPCPYPVAFSAGAQSFGNSSGYKHIIGMLVEARSSAGPSRPAEGSGAGNRRRKAYSHLWIDREVLNYHRTDRALIQGAIAKSIAFQASNTGRIVFDGDYDWPAYPAPHPGEDPPPNNRPDASDILEVPPCGYLLTEAQYSTPLNDGGGIPVNLWTSPAQRLDAHGMKVVPRGLDTYYVAMAQPLRGMIPLVLDPVTPPRPIIAAQRISTCYPITGDFSAKWGPVTVVLANAGSAVPLKFSLGGDRGLGVLAQGAPSSRPVDCGTLAALGASETAGGSALQYAAAADQYTYTWQTSKAWEGTCREFALGLDDGTSYARYFRVTTADRNGDGVANCADLAIVKGSFAKRSGQTGFDPRADVDNDGVVDIKDWTFINQIVPVSTC